MTSCSVGLKLSGSVISSSLLVVYPMMNERMMSADNVDDVVVTLRNKETKLSQFNPIGADSIEVLYFYLPTAGTGTTLWSVYADKPNPQRDSLFLSLFLALTMIPLTISFSWKIRSYQSKVKLWSCKKINHACKNQSSANRHASPGPYFYRVDW